MTNTKAASGLSASANTAKTINCKAWNSALEHHNWEYKFYIKDSSGNMFSPVYLKEGQVRKYSEM